ncbi:MAG TPA: CinA family protein [Dehalococcoidia bacterium]|nr:CinA family protein [Dehalococcoidia bacterium]
MTTEAQQLASRVIALLSGRGLTLSVAESCTGGFISHLLTNVPGSSRCFLGGATAYHNRAKTALLGVPEDLLREHGSVSAEAALAMARGVRERLDADIAIGVTGIAGPGGGSPQKPPGTVYIALVVRDRLSHVRHERWEGDRQAYKEQTAARAFQVIEEYLD